LSAEVPCYPILSRRGLLRSATVRWSSESTGARREGDLRRVHRGSWRSRSVLVDRRVAEVSGGPRDPHAQACGAGYDGDGRRSGPVKVAVFDEMAGGGGPGASSRRESNPAPRERDRERQRQDRDLASGRQRRQRRERRSKRPRSRAHRVERGWAPGEEPRGHLGSLPKLEARRQARLHSIMLPSRFRPGGWHGSSLPGESHGRG